MKHTNHGYIGYNASGGPRGVMNLNEHYLRIAHPTPPVEALDIVPGSTLQAATLVFVNTKMDRYSSLYDEGGS
tara:strand:+ start:138 stop:356 length:219 start_codon:yes stop_codon:yes gene_type:complete